MDVITKKTQCLIRMDCLLKKSLSNNSAHWLSVVLEVNFNNAQNVPMSWKSMLFN